MPRTCPASLSRCASAIWSSGKVCATGQREGARLDQVTDLAQRVHRAPGPHPAAELHAGVLRSGVVGDRDHALGTAGQLHQGRQRAATGGIHSGVDTIGGERPDALHQAVAVGRRFGAERAQILVVGLARGPDHLRAPRTGDLHGGAADRAGGAVDEHRRVSADAHRIERPHGSLHGDR